MLDDDVTQHSRQNKPPGGTDSQVQLMEHLRVFGGRFPTSGWFFRRVFL